MRKQVNHIRVELVKKKDHYKLFLIGAESTVIVFTGGHVTMDNDLVELGRSYKRFDKVSKKLLIEEGGIEDFDFKIWYWIDIIKHDQTIKYFFHLQENELKPREEDMPVENRGYIIKKIWQSDRDTLTVQFWLDKDYEFIIKHDEAVFYEKGKTKAKVTKAILDICKQIKFDDWAATVHKHSKGLYVKHKIM